MNWLKDTRIECWSVLTVITVREYLELVKNAHSARGGIQGQRDVLKTTTAKRIRDRMVNDIIQGAVIPPVVVGATVESSEFETYPLEQAKTFKDVFPQGNDTLAIIDGMQRTAALFEATRKESAVFERQMRVELWLSRNVRAMVYRMLVLNTGQVPWTLSRQLTVVYDSLLKEIKANVPGIDKIPSADSPGRRVAAGQYAADDLVELYLAFSLRKTALDTKEAISEEFSRLDFVENLSDTSFQSQFYQTLSLMVQLDKAFSRYDSESKERYSKGRDVFGGQPSRIGFVVAVAQHVLGRPGQDRDADERQKRMTTTLDRAAQLVNRLNNAKPEEVERFLNLDVLSEILDRRVGQVGRYERSVFFEAFKVLIEEAFDVPNMEPCWRAN